jgi:hypothetical protein
MTVSDSLHSLLDYERLRHSLGSDLRIDHFFSFRCPPVNTPQLNTQLSYEWTLFYNSGRTEQRPPPRTVRLLLRGSSVVAKRIFGEALSGNWLFRVYSLPGERAYRTDA